MSREVPEVADLSIVAGGGEVFVAYVRYFREESVLSEVAGGFWGVGKIGRGRLDELTQLYVFIF